jgi:metal-responsive CopG/Arc/MetJ family transcriptional regulator
VPSTKNRVVVLLPDDILESMKLQAQKENRSMSNMILIALKKYLEESRK